MLLGALFVVLSVLSTGIKSIIVLGLIYSRCVNIESIIVLSLFYSRCDLGGLCRNCQEAGRHLRGNCLARNGLTFNCCLERCLLCFQCTDTPSLPKPAPAAPSTPPIPPPNRRQPPAWPSPPQPHQNFLPGPCPLLYCPTSPWIPRSRLKLSRLWRGRTDEGVRWAGWRGTSAQTGLQSRSCLATEGNSAEAPNKAFQIEQTARQTIINLIHVGSAVCYAFSALNGN